jgi:hypothetical protein
MQSSMSVRGVAGSALSPSGLSRHGSQAWPARRNSMSSGAKPHSLGSFCAATPTLGQRLNIGGRASSIGTQGMTSAAVAEAAAGAEQQQQQWQHADDAQDGSTEQRDETAAGLGAADVDSFFAAEAADAFADRPVSFAARGRSCSLRQTELGRRSMPLPPLARNRSMGNVALPGAAATGSGVSGGSAAVVLNPPVTGPNGGGSTSSLARLSAGLGRSSVSFSCRSASVGGGPLEQQLQRTSWLPRQGTGLFQGSPGR